jgi:hypothetical protein
MTARGTRWTAEAARRRLAPAAALLLLACACSSQAPENDTAAVGGEAPAAAAPRPAAPPPAAEDGTAAPAGDETGTAAPSPAGAEEGGPIATACTQIGCSDGLRVELDGFREEVELELAAGGETRTVTCLPPGPCRHFVPDFAPAEVTATAFLGDREEERTFEPEYREERPNGRDCPPVCRQAEIRWKL